MDRKSAILATAAAACLTPTRLLAAAPATRPASNEGIPVAFVVGQNANAIDLAGSYEAFTDMEVSAQGSLPPNGADHFGNDPAARPAFSVYLVSDSVEPITVGRNLIVTPTYSFAEAPPPRVIVMGAQRGRSNAKLDWIREMSRTADVVMSVCTGAFLLAETGLLDGKRATTHHDYYDEFAKSYPKVTLVRGPRFVDNGKFKTAGGLTSGIELAIHVVEQFYGVPRADLLARYLEYDRSSTRPA